MSLHSSNPLSTARSATSYSPIMEKYSAANAYKSQQRASEATIVSHHFLGLQILTDIEKGKLYECWQDLVDTAAFNNGFKYLRSCIRGGKVRLSVILQKFCEKIAFLEESADDIEIRRSDLEGMVRILDDYDEIYGDWQLSARIESILRFLEKQAEQEYKYHNFKQKDPDVDAVRIMTVHKAKGLEFHTVFLPKLTKNEFPILKQSGKRYYHVLKGVFEENKDKYQSDLEDERKLFYVAVTRAKQNLFMTYELLTQPVSCFVKEAAESQYLKIERNDLEFVPTPKPKKRKAQARQRLKLPLLIWRKQPILLTRSMPSLLSTPSERRKPRQRKSSD